MPWRIRGACRDPVVCHVRLLFLRSLGDTLKLDEFLKKQPSAMEATLALNRMGVPASYFSVLRWREKKNSPSKAWRLLLAAKGLT